LVSIAGTNTLAFFNFLINSKSFLVATAGPYAGIPPTILSPAAFHGATLKNFKVKSQIVNFYESEFFVWHQFDNFDMTTGKAKQDKEY